MVIIFFLVNKTILILDNKLFEARVYDPDLKKIDDLSLTITSTAYNYSFKPEKYGKHIVSLVQDNVAVAGWPFIVIIFV